MAFCSVLLSCAAGMVEPSKGVTERFFRQTKESMLNLDEYDFTRLKQGYGLCVFSYEVSGRRGNIFVGRSYETKKGIRVWEHRFSEGDPKIVRIEKRMMIWGYRGASTFFLTKSGYDIKIGVPFHRGQIAYGGRLIVYYPEGGLVESHYEEDFAPWVNQYGDKLSDIEIETRYMIEVL